MAEAGEGVGDELVVTGRVERCIGDEEGDLVLGGELAEGGIEAVVMPSEVPSEGEVEMVATEEIAEGREMLLRALVIAAENFPIKGGAGVTGEGDEVLHPLAGEVEVLAQ